MTEIGSEFPYMPLSADGEYGENRLDGLLTFSGRAAIAAVLSDLLRSRPVSRAWLPSYCCASMIAPFAAAGIPVSFYGVQVGDGPNPLAREVFVPDASDVVLSMGYFGFRDKGHEALMTACLQNGITVIEDNTHGWLSVRRSPAADYTVASLRKWTAVVAGGCAAKRDGRLAVELSEPDARLAETRLEAMREKAAYLGQGGPLSQKQSFLAKYRAGNQAFEAQPFLKAIDPYSHTYLQHLPLAPMIEQRRRNAAVLLEGLRELDGIRSLYTAVGPEDCPLFVPILLPNAKALQAYLAQQEIYCPMHWPRPTDRAVSDLYGHEVSLICDQRYTESDMQRILTCLHTFCEENIDGCVLSS